MLEEAKTVFDDTLPEYSVISAIKQQFEGWKFSHNDSYCKVSGVCYSLPNEVLRPTSLLVFLKFLPLMFGTSC